MSVSREEIRRIASLAKLRLSPDEERALAADLNDILEHVVTLEVAADGSESDVGAMAGEAPAPPPERPAEADALAHPPAAIAPEWVEGFFVVPRLPAVDGPAGESERSRP